MDPAYDTTQPILTRLRHRAGQLKESDPDRLLLDDTAKIADALLGACKEAEAILPSHSEILDYASLNDGRASAAGVVAEQLRAAIAKATKGE